MTEFMVFLWFIICFFHKKFPLKKHIFYIKVMKNIWLILWLNLCFFFFMVYFMFFFHKILQKNHILF